jgi:o-succinylbenzoate---CoA ligase
VERRTTIVVTYAQLESWVHAGGEPLVVRTSGSSGEPKDVVLSHAAFLASARATLDRLGGPGHWLLALPVSGIAGIQVLVRSALAAREPIALADHLSLRSAIDALDSSTRRYTAVVPTQLYRWAAADELGILAELDAVLVGGAALDPDLRATAVAAGVRLIRTYGMTETCGGCVYDGVPLDGVEVHIDDGADGAGQILLRGPMLFDGYGSHRREPGSWFATADRGRIRDDGRLEVLGRMDETVISGGVNIPLPAVEDAVRRASGVAAAAVVGVPDAEWGTRVVAVVVPADGASVGLAELRDAVEVAGLARTWAPRQLLTLSELPMLPAGKVDRERLRRLTADTPPT